jgi:hypothetical protein
MRDAMALAQRYSALVSALKREQEDDHRAGQQNSSNKLCAGRAADSQAVRLK